MSDKTTTVAQLKAQLKKFIDERDWDQFHNPKNLSMSIGCEAAELMEHFQWATTEEEINAVVDKKRTEIEHELADVIILALTFSNRINVDVTGAIERKMQHNAEKYPVEKAKGKSTKYTEL